jgi:hypothetical protein
LWTIAPGWVPGGYSDLPGPGEYHGEHHELAHPDGPGGFTIYERTKSLEFKPGMESPGPAHYGGFTTDDVEPGLQMSIHPRFESGGAYSSTRTDRTPQGRVSTPPRCSSSRYVRMEETGVVSHSPSWARPWGTPSGSGGPRITRYENLKSEDRDLASTLRRTTV